MVIDSDQLARHLLERVNYCQDCDFAFLSKLAVGSRFFYRHPEHRLGGCNLFEAFTGDGLIIKLLLSAPIVRKES